MENSRSLPRFVHIHVPTHHPASVNSSIHLSPLAKNQETLVSSISQIFLLFFLIFRNPSPKRGSYHSFFNPIPFTGFHLPKQMAAKPLTSEAIALTEKKMDMTLEDIIKMSKSNPSKAKKQRVPNKSQSFLNNVALDKSSKVRRFMESRSTLRQGALAQRRSNFQRNQFPLATDAAQKAVVAPIRNRTFNRGRMMSGNMNVNKPRVVAPSVQRRAANGGFVVKQQQQQQQQVKVVPKQQQRPQTLDSLFANMKEQRMRGLSQQNNSTGRQNGGGRQRQQWGRGGRFGN